MPCTSRALPSACYSLRITLLAPPAAPAQQAGLSEATTTGMPPTAGWLLGGGLLLLLASVAFVVFRRKAPAEAPPQGTAVPIGAFLFDRAKLELSFQDQKTELSAKEAELLHLLHGNMNETVAREQMLKEVWGNNNDYVGRTLDVFVSKLRKKLEADPNIRIANIRGVGYRLILDS
jgi:DNA-binding response OmpR family regulator